MRLDFIWRNDAKPMRQMGTEIMQEKVSFRSANIPE
jgi:hypothetical protein